MLIKDKRLATRSIGGTMYVVSPWDHMLHRFKETGTFIWEMLEKGASEKEIVAQTAQAFDISPEEAENDVNEFIELMCQKGIIHKDHGRASGS